jgi:putative flippase GtrA
MPRIIREYLRYSVIAAIGISLHAAIMYSLTEWVGFPYMLSFTLGLPASHTVKFTMDKFWTFKTARVSMPGLAVSNG